ncbi:MAG TPA: ATP-dependent DNA helicase RecG [Hyphomonadaceae bacterium]|nr:ATP-dependent DNA helicase RecG [Hyphomonadaceae bacterium]
MPAASPSVPPKQASWLELLDQPIAHLPKLGPKTAPLVEKACGGARIADLIAHQPHRIIERMLCPQILAAPIGEAVMLEGIVDHYLPPPTAKAPHRVRLRDDSGFLTLIFFRAERALLQKLFPIGARRLVCGVIEAFGPERQMAHPDHVLDPALPARPPLLEPVYGLVAGLTNKAMRRAISAALAALKAAPASPEWIDPHLLRERQWPDFLAALKALHMPDGVEPAARALAIERLAYDELFARQMQMTQRRSERLEKTCAPIAPKGLFVAQAFAALPFTPTHGQREAVEAIIADLRLTRPMARLLQGDVGAGKTLVAAMAAIHVAEAGGQSALMAPTDLLARQHWTSVSAFAAPLGLACGLLSGKMPKAERAAIQNALADGRYAIVCGTHALFQETVRFADLRLVIIDEQHRFGVGDRQKLQEKAQSAHVLSMSATPIPRTLALTAFGDLDVSILPEKPVGRAPVTTRAVSIERIEDVLAAIERALERHERIYWVCPAIAASEDDAIQDVEARFAQLNEIFGACVGLAHGKMPVKTRQDAMTAFKDGQVKILVATTVIEVGVDNPDATIMVIENAERFGLSQLHQLRGRVGRGAKPSMCLLLHHPPLTDMARQRLDALRRIDDGFAIAELDYQLRGAGDVLGLAQSGAPRFRFADPWAHRELIAIADRDCRALLAVDPRLGSPRAQAALRLALLFGKDYRVGDGAA